MRQRRFEPWAAGVACLFLGGVLASAALSTAAETSTSARGSIVSAHSPAPFPGSVPSDGRRPAELTGPAPVAPALASHAVTPNSIEIPEIDALMAKAIRAGRTPGAVVLVGRRSGVVFRHAYGRRAIIPEREEMTVDTIFDLASLTKPMVIAPLVQWLIEQRRLDIREVAVKYLPEFGVRDKYLVTVEQLLLHTSGLPPTNSLNDYKHGPEKARELALGGWLYKYPGREFIYSDIGYIALGELIENITGERLDVTAARVIWGPLGMSDTHYCPIMCPDPRIAPTEANYGWKKNPIRGEASDTRAHRLGGVAGNAGVFSSADDIAKFARMLLGEGELEGVRVLAPERVRDMLRPRSVPKAKRALGWDVSSGFSSGRGHSLSDRAVGHSGYTGTSLWIDPVLDVFIVFLSNRNHPFSMGKVTDLQGPVADAAVRALYPDGVRPVALAPDGAPPHSMAVRSEAPPSPASACPDGVSTCPDRESSLVEHLHNAGG